jgi:hypothetical protein
MLEQSAKSLENVAAALSDPAYRQVPYIPASKIFVARRGAEGGRRITRRASCPQTKTPWRSCISGPWRLTLIVLADHDGSARLDADSGKSSSW